MDIKICLTDITDALALDENEIVVSIFSYARKIVKQGGSIVIEQTYGNAQPNVLAKYSTEQEIENWKNKLNEIQIILHRDVIAL